ncbi:MAG: hypothetical protein ACTHVE_08320, partial [Senegalia sp. (in: firmicutes)]
NSSPYLKVGAFLQVYPVRVPIAYGIAYLTRSEQYPTGRPESVFISLLMSWTIGAIITTIFFRRGKWREKSIVK